MKKSTKLSANTLRAAPAADTGTHWHLLIDYYLIVMIEV